MIDWGAEFCAISEIFQFTPSEMLELSAPVFFMYARYANEQKAYQPNLKNINEYLEIVMGKKKQPQMKEDDPNNYIWKIKEAKEALMKQTGRKEFSLPEVLSEINSPKPEPLDKSDNR